MIKIKDNTHYRALQIKKKRKRYLLSLGVKEFALLRFSTIYIYVDESNVKSYMHDKAAVSEILNTTSPYIYFTQSFNLKKSRIDDYFTNLLNRNVLYLEKHLRLKLESYD